MRDFVRSFQPSFYAHTLPERRVWRSVVYLLQLLVVCELVRAASFYVFHQRTLEPLLFGARGGGEAGAEAADTPSCLQQLVDELPVSWSATVNLETREVRFNVDSVSLRLPPCAADAMSMGVRFLSHSAMVNIWEDFAQPEVRLMTYRAFSFSRRAAVAAANAGNKQRNRKRSLDEMDEEEAEAEAKAKANANAKAQEDRETNHGERKAVSGDTRRVLLRKEGLDARSRPLLIVVDSAVGASESVDSSTRRWIGFTLFDQKALDWFGLNLDVWDLMCDAQADSHELLCSKASLANFASALTLVSDENTDLLQVAFWAMFVLVTCVLALIEASDLLFSMFIVYSLGNTLHVGVAQEPPGGGEPDVDGIPFERPEIRFSQVAKVCIHCCTPIALGLSVISPFASQAVGLGFLVLHVSLSLHILLSQHRERLLREREDVEAEMEVDEGDREGNEPQMNTMHAASPNAMGELVAEDDERVLIYRRAMHWLEYKAHAPDVASARTLQDLAAATERLASIVERSNLRSGIGAAFGVRLGVCCHVWCNNGAGPGYAFGLSSLGAWIELGRYDMPSPECVEYLEAFPGNVYSVPGGQPGFLPTKSDLLRIQAQLDNLRRQLNLLCQGSETRDL